MMTISASGSALSANVPSTIENFDSSVNLSPKSQNSIKLQEDIQNSSQLSSQSFNDANSLLIQSNTNQDSERDICNFCAIMWIKIISGA